MTRELVATCNIQKEQGYLYFVNREGNVIKTKMRAHQTGETQVIVAHTRIVREPNYLYYVGQDGNVYRSQMHRGGTKGRRTRPRKHRTSRNRRARVEREKHKTYHG